jgi:putative ABC transport system permease protein
MQQLSQSIDNMEKYNILKKIGTGQSMINRSVFLQVAIYFFIPLLVTLVQSVFGIRFVNDFVALTGSPNTMKEKMLHLS